MIILLLFKNNHQNKHQNQKAGVSDAYEKSENLE